MDKVTWLIVIMFLTAFGIPVKESACRVLCAGLSWLDGYGRPPMKRGG